MNLSPTVARPQQERSSLVMIIRLNRAFEERGQANDR
jgi:hypothetical protein